MEPIFTVLRVIVALAAVLALIWLFGRRLAKRNHTLSRGRIRTIARQGLGPRQSVQVLDLDQTRYVLGVADHSVSVLDSYPVPETERTAAKPDDTDADTTFAGHLSAAQSGSSRAGPAQSQPPVSLPPPSGGFQIERARLERAQVERPQPDQHQVEPLRGGGSILSPQTWRQAVDAIRRGPQR